jgi:subtilisin family serine protease
MNPLARKNRIFTENLPEEVILYDKSNHNIHCLNKMAAAIWENSDGSRTVDDLARILETKFGVPAGRDVVFQALQELEKADLMENANSVVSRPALTSRRGAVGKIALAGSALVTTIVAQPVSARISSGPVRTRTNGFVRKLAKELPSKMAQGK